MKAKDLFGDAIVATPLHYCETVDEALPFLAQGYKGDEKVEGLSSAIHTVESIELLKAFLDNGADPDAGKPGATPLHTHTDVSMLKFLIEYGADVNALDCFGRSPMHCCTSTESLKLLFEYGANPSIRDEDGELPIDAFEGLEEQDRMTSLYYELKK